MHSDFLFVYGTLRRGSKHPMQQLLTRHSRYCGQALFQGRLYDIGGYPGVIAAPEAQDLVHGDLLQLTSPELLEQLDRYEEAGQDFPAPQEYVRQQTLVLLAAGGQRSCWIYLYNRPVARLRLIVSGDYLQYLAGRAS